MAKSNSTKYRKMSPTFIAKTQEWLDNFLSYKFATCIISNDVRTCAYNVCHSYCQRDWPGLKLNFGFHKKKQYLPGEATPSMFQVIAFSHFFLFTTISNQHKLLNCEKL